ncbi:MAG: hypothetical protein ACRC2U_07815 [Aeromonas sp.]
MSEKPNNYVFGRPTEYTPELAKDIINGIVDGVSLRTLCATKSEWPTRRTILYWVAKGAADAEAKLNTPLADFFHQYMQAQQLRAELLLDEATDIADDGTNDWMERLDRGGQPIGWMLNGEAVARSKLRVETRLKLVEKLSPKKYTPSTKLKVGGDEDNPAPVTFRLKIDNN